MVGNSGTSSLLQPSVNLKLDLKNVEVSEDVGDEQTTLNLMLDLAAFDKLRFSVAKALSCTNAYKQN